MRIHARPRNCATVSTETETRTMMFCFESSVTLHHRNAKRAQGCFVSKVVSLYTIVMGIRAQYQ